MRHHFSRALEVDKALLDTIGEGLGNELQTLLERSTQVMSAVTLEETQAVLHSLMSSEKLNATAQGRQAEEWAGSSTKFTNKDGKALFSQLDKEKTGKIDLQAFLDKIVGLIKVGGRDQELTAKQKKALEKEE